MADAKSDYLENAILDHVLRNTALSSPATVYCALFTVAPTDVGGGTEVTGFAYARQAVTFTAAAGGSTANTGTVAFPTASGGAWGTVVAFGIFDALTVGNLLYYGDLAVSKVVGNGDTISFAGGALTVSET